jgi:large conductance mechanosensitive channel
MKIVQEFRQFIQRGNVIDLAVGVIMGGAFGKIVNSLVADILMPPIGYLIGGVKFTDLKITLPTLPIGVSEAAGAAGAIDPKLAPATINYGQFLQTSFDFLIIAASIFLVIKAMNNLKRRSEPPPPPPAPPEPTATEKLLLEIRDLLKQANDRCGENPGLR